MAEEFDDIYLIFLIDQTWLCLARWKVLGTIKVRLYGQPQPSTRSRVIVIKARRDGHHKFGYR